MKNIRMNHVSGGKYEILHPETNTAQIVDISTGKTLEQLIQGGDLGGSGATSLSNVQFPLVSTVDKQTDFPFNDALFSVTDIVKVYINGEFLYPEEYSVDTSGVLPKIVLVRQLPVGTHVLIDVWRNVLTEGVGAVSGSVIMDKSLSTSKLSTDSKGMMDLNGMKTIDNTIRYYIDPVNGNDDNDGTSIDNPVKTLNKLGTLASNIKTLKVSQNVDLIFSPGVYSGILHLYNTDRLSIIADRDVKFVTPDTVVDTSTFIDVKHCDNVWIKGITFEPGVLSSTYHKGIIINDSTVTINKCTFVGTNLPKEYQTEGMVTTPIRYDRSFLHISECTFTDWHIPIYGDASTSVISQSVFNDCEAFQSNYGTKVYYDAANTHTGKKPQVIGSGIDVNALNDSIVLESGTNTNGRYIKYGDGRLECYMTINIESTIDSGITSIWTFPHIFTPDAVHGYVDLFCNVKSVTSNIDGYDNLSIGYTTNNAPAQAVIRFNSTANQKLDVSCMAIGRWK